MRKTVIVEREKEVFFCDLCGEEIDTYNTCHICRRELCDKCSKDMKYTSSMWFPPCPICVKLKGKYFNDIQKCFKEAEELQDKGHDLMSKWGQDSKDKEDLPKR